MSIRATIKTNVKKFEKAIAKWPEEMHKALRIGITRSAEHVTKMAQLKLTHNRSVAFGLLRASIGWEITDDGKTVTGSIGPGLSNKASAAPTGDPRNYGIFVERGRGPGRPPPRRILSLWVKRKLGLGEPENSRVTFLIARQIAARGTTPAPFLVPSLLGSKSKIKVLVDRELSKKAAELEAR